MLRIPRTRGFGVQSPTAYSFLRHVLNEQVFLKRYNLLDAQTTPYPFDASRQERLLFRIHHHCQDMRIIQACNLLSHETYEALFSGISSESVVVVQGIDEGKAEKQIWSRLLADKRTVLTFDLCHLGIVFFDKTKNKQNFKVNY